jgi:glucose-6-phosphate dehydrogenase assembly protein OpcA
VAAAVSEEVWSAADTSPREIEEALRELLSHRHAREEAFVPARVLNLVVIVDGAYRGEVENRLERIRSYHPSRTVFCAVTPGRTSIDAWASMAADDAVPKAGHLAVARERIELEVGEGHLRGLDTVVGPLLVTDLATLVWAPHGHVEAVRALRRIAQIALIDSVDEPDLDTALQQAVALADDLYVVDLAWLRSTPWRERVAAAFDPPQMRRALPAISSVTVRHRHDSAASAVLFCGWLAARLRWRPERLIRSGDALTGRARAHRGEVALKLEPVQQPGAPGLSGVTLEIASGEAVSLDRAPGGLHEVRRRRDGREQGWTVLGASRGEAGILGEGVRQALLRDPAYRPALECATAMVAA